MDLRASSSIHRAYSGTWKDTALLDGWVSITIMLLSSASMQGQALADNVMKLAIGGTGYRNFSGSITMTQPHFQAVVHRWSYYQWQCSQDLGAD